MEYIQPVADELDNLLPDRDQQSNPIQLNQLHDALSQIDTILSERSSPKAIFLDVIHRHLQALLQAINEPAKEEETNEPRHPRLNSPSLKRLFMLPLEYHEHEFMHAYFSGIRQRVVSVAFMVAGAGKVSSQDGAGDASLKIHLTSNRDTDRRPTLTPSDTRFVWCALVFRTIICWLQLHDFDEQDVQLPKSEVQGSRLSASML